MRLKCHDNYCLGGSRIVCYFSPTIWALVFGGLFGSSVTLIGSYFLIPGIAKRFQLSKKFSSEIFHFGKWIFISSVLYFLSTNFDRLYLAKAVPLQLLGVYGIARSISEMLGLVVLRLGIMCYFLSLPRIHISRATTCESKWRRCVQNSCLLRLSASPCLPLRRIFR